MTVTNDMDHVIQRTPFRVDKDHGSRKIRGMFGTLKLRLETTLKVHFQEEPSNRTSSRRQTTHKELHHIFEVRIKKGWLVPRRFNHKEVRHLKRTSICKWTTTLLSSSTLKQAQGIGFEFFQTLNGCVICFNAVFCRMSKEHFSLDMKTRTYKKTNDAVA